MEACSITQTRVCQSFESEDMMKLGIRQLFTQIVSLHNYLNFNIIKSNNSNIFQFYLFSMVHRRIQDGFYVVKLVSLSAVMARSTARKLIHCCTTPSMNWVKQCRNFCEAVHPCSLRRNYKRLLFWQTNLYPGKVVIYKLYWKKKLQKAIIGWLQDG